jgi:hypothetical protein
MFKIFGRAKPAERQIFRYWDGEKERHADPIEMFRRMAVHDTFDLEGHLKDLTASVPQVQLEAEQITVDAVREIFGVKAWSEDCPTGLTRGETMNLLGQFIMYTDALKKNGNGHQT